MTNVERRDGDWEYKKLFLASISDVLGMAFVSDLKSLRLQSKSYLPQKLL